MVKARANKQLNNTIRAVKHDFRTAEGGVVVLWVHITDTDGLEYEYEFRSDERAGDVEVYGPILVAQLEAAIGSLSKVHIQEYTERIYLFVEIGGKHIGQYTGVRLHPE